jgi:uncharacterized phage protein gp47/JayE
MPLDKLPDGFAAPTRDGLRDQALRDWRSRVPSVQTGSSTDPFVICSSLADALIPAYANTVLAAAAQDIDNAVGLALDAWGARLDGGSGELDRKGVGSSSGFVTLVTATGGGNILAGTELKEIQSGQKFVSSVTDVYTSLTPLAIQSVAGGAVANLPGGTKLSFTSPPAGISQNCIVLTDSSGNGLTGGAPAEDDDTYRRRLKQAIKEPPASGNEAEVVRVLTSVRDLPVQAAFCIPAVFGPGTYAWCVTLQPATPGDSRIPNGAQLAELEAAVKDAFPADDGSVGASGAEHGFRFVVQVTWKSTAPSWIDETTWPPLVATPVTVSGTPTASAVRVTSVSAYTAPTVGKTIGFLDLVTKKFKRKRILTATLFAANTYDLTFDMTTLQASDPSFVPAVGAVVSPWSDSLDEVVLPLLNYVDLQGPGEMFATFGDPGRRQRRFPPPAPDYFPSKIENRVVDGLFSVVDDAEIIEPAVPFDTTVGTPGVLVYLHRVTDIGVFPQ